MRFCRSSPLRWWTASPVAVELMGRLDELAAARVAEVRPQSRLPCTQSTEVLERAVTRVRGVWATLDRSALAPRPLVVD
jgi:hypothetical protein